MYIMLSLVITYEIRPWHGAQILTDPFYNDPFQFWINFKLLIPKATLQNELNTFYIIVNFIIFMAESSLQELHLTYDNKIEGIAALIKQGYAYLKSLDLEQYDWPNILILWAEIIGLAILTIWARAVGPRFRIDQMHELTWKDLLVVLTTIVLTLSLLAG